MNLGSDTTLTTTGKGESLFGEELEAHLQPFLRRQFVAFGVHRRQVQVAQHRQLVFPSRVDAVAFDFLDL